MATFTVRNDTRNLFALTGAIFGSGPGDATAQRKFQLVLDANRGVDFENLKAGQSITIPDDSSFTGFVSNEDFAAATGIQPGATGTFDFLNPPTDGVVADPTGLPTTGDPDLDQRLLTASRIEANAARAVAQPELPSLGQISPFTGRGIGVEGTVQPPTAGQVSPFTGRSVGGLAPELPGRDFFNVPGQTIRSDDSFFRQPQAVGGIAAQEQIQADRFGASGGQAFIRPFNTQLTDTATGTTAEQAMTADEQFLDQQEAFLATSGNIAFSDDFASQNQLTLMDLRNSGFVKTNSGYASDPVAQDIIQEAEAQSGQLPTSEVAFNPNPLTFFTGQSLGFDGGGTTATGRPQAVRSPINTFTSGRGVLINWRTGGFG